MKNSCFLFVCVLPETISHVLWCRASKTKPERCSIIFLKNQRTESKVARAPRKTNITECREPQRQPPNSVLKVYQIFDWSLNYACLRIFQRPELKATAGRIKELIRNLSSWSPEKKHVLEFSPTKLTAPKNNTKKKKKKQEQQEKTLAQGLENIICLTNGTAVRELRGEGKGTWNSRTRCPFPLPSPQMIWSWGGKAGRWGLRRVNGKSGRAKRDAWQ